MASGGQVTPASIDRAMTSSALAAAAETDNRCWRFVGCRSVPDGRKLQTNGPWNGSRPPAVAAAAAAVARGHVPEAVKNGQDVDDSRRAICCGLEPDDDDWAAAAGKAARTRRRLGQGIKLDAVKFPVSFRRVFVMSTARRGVHPKFPSAAEEVFTFSGKSRHRHPKRASSVTCCPGCTTAVAALRLLERRVDRLEAALNDVTGSGFSWEFAEQRQPAAEATDELTDVNEQCDHVTAVDGNSFAWSRTASVAAADITSSPTQSGFDGVCRNSTLGGRKTFSAVQPKSCLCDHVGAQSFLATDVAECCNCIHDLDESPPDVTRWQGKAARLLTHCDVTACHSRPLATAVEHGQMTSSSTGFGAKCACVQQQTKDWKTTGCCCVERDGRHHGSTGLPVDDDEPTQRSDCCCCRKSFRPSGPWDRVHASSVSATVPAAMGCCPCVLQQLRKKAMTECLHCRPCSNSALCDTLKCSTGTESSSFRPTRQAPRLRGCYCCHASDTDEEELGVCGDKNFTQTDRGYIDVIDKPVVERHRCCQTYYRWRDSRNRQRVGNPEDSSPYAPFRPVNQSGYPNVQNDRHRLRDDVISDNGPGGCRHQPSMGRGGRCVVERPGSAFLNYLRSTTAVVTTGRTSSSYHGVVGPLPSSTRDQRSEQVDWQSRAKVDRRFQCSTFTAEQEVVAPRDRHYVLADVRARNLDLVVQSSPEVDPHQIGLVVEDDEDVTGSTSALAPCSCCNGRTTLTDPALTRARLTSATDECSSSTNLMAKVTSFVRPVAVATRSTKRPIQTVDENSATQTGVGNAIASKLPRHSLVAAVVQQAGAASGIKGQSKSLTLATSTSSADSSDDPGKAADAVIAGAKCRPNTHATSENASTVRTGCGNSISKDLVLTSSAGRKLTQALAPRDPSVFSQPILPVTDEQLLAFSDALKILEEDIEILTELVDDDACQSFSECSDERREAKKLRKAECERNRRNAATANGSELAVKRPHPFRPSALPPPTSSPAPTSDVKSAAVRQNVPINAPRSLPFANIATLLPAMQTNGNAVEDEQHENGGPVSAVATGTARHNRPADGNAVEQQNNVSTAAIETAVGNADVCVGSDLQCVDDGSVGCCHGNRAQTVDHSWPSTVPAAVALPSVVHGPLNLSVAFTVEQQSRPTSDNRRASGQSANAAAAAAVDAPLGMRQLTLAASVSDKSPGTGSQDGAPVSASVTPQQLLTSAAATADVSDEDRASARREVPDVAQAQEQQPRGSIE